MPLQIERLEDRRLLAAGISLSGGVLTVEGTGTANSIFVHGDEFGELLYAGLDRNGDGDFDDPGDILKVFDAAQVKSIVINSKGGDDMVLVDLDNGIAGDVVVNTGAGSDIIQVVHLSARDIRINTGAGHDQVDLFEFEARRDVQIKTSAGDDLVTIVGGGIWRNLNVDTGAGDDTVGFGDLWIDGKVNIKLGAGNDLLDVDIEDIDADFSKVKIDAGKGTQDRLIIDSCHEPEIPDGITVKNFEIVETSFEGLSTTTLAKLDLISHRYEAAELRFEEFHEVIHPIIYGPIP